KSSLLRKAAADLALDRRPNAYVNLEAFKGSSYPDVLLSVLISTFERFNDWLETTSLNYACQPSFGRKLWQQINDSFPKLFRVRPPATGNRSQNSLSGARSTSSAITLWNISGTSSTSPSFRPAIRTFFWTTCTTSGGEINRK